ncbi:MAG: TIGR03663 family protein [Dehalococcoidia bacterium]|nr:TIGR03663 family protein [Dehalococcoidia bacterium]
MGDPLLAGASQETIGEEPKSEEPKAVQAAPCAFVLPSRVELALYAGLVLIALVMHLWGLGSRAMHHDESLHAVYGWYLYEGRGYVHDPMMHGPFQFHGIAFMYFLFGDSEYTARLLPALFGTVLVALPYFLRSRLGTLGALFTAGLLAFSPAILYFSRFAREDIYMAVWALGLVIAVWKYLDTQQHRYLYLTAALLALAFATKETAYLTTFVVGSYLFILATPDLVAWARGRLKPAQADPAARLFILMLALTIPLAASAVALVNSSLANPDFTQGRVGLPSGLAAGVVAATTVLALFWAAFLLGHSWWRGAWWRSAALFWGIWLVLFTALFTNWGGVVTGLWQSLGYWIAQQDVARGGQPWYYYFVIGFVYEFLPLLFAAIGGVYYAVKGDRFTRFLAYWVLLTLLLFSVAGEKMPWLLVQVMLPMIVLAGKFLGDAAQAVPWRMVMARGGWMAAPLVPLFILFAVRLALFPRSVGGANALLALGLLSVAVAGILTAFGLLASRVGVGPVLRVAALSLAGVLFLFTVRAGWIATYRHGDTPVDMMVYTQTSPSIPRIAKELDELRRRNGGSLSITVDSTDGYSWPWAWYLRNTEGVSYPCLSADPGCTSMKTPPDGDVVLLASRNEPLAVGKMDGYTRVEQYPHRWWFPEFSTMNYRGVTPASFLGGLTSRDSWRTLWDYWLYRKIKGELGSSDAVVYYGTEAIRLVRP